MTRPRALAFYLPQFHAIPENDRWWGPGFTEWVNVVQAQPRFRGHEQPHLPADLGFYDLRMPEVRAQQASLARAAGLDGFVYYHYWFGGRRLLERPFAEVLASGEPDFPFALCWANEGWTRAWDGKSGETLVEQRYSDEDDAAHLRWLAEAFDDPRHLRVDGKPLFLVYRAGDLPDARRTTETWRTEAARRGIGELFLARVESGPAEHIDPRPLGFDAAVEFQPDWGRLGHRRRYDHRWGVARRLHLTDTAHLEHRIYDYDAVVAGMLATPPPDYPRFPGVTPRWDNSARRQVGATILVGSTPTAYGRWLAEVVARRPEGVAGELVFVNAWNEWAEGNHLEPDQRWGHAYLDATRTALSTTDVPAPPVVDATLHQAAPPPAPGWGGGLRRSVEYRARRRARRLRRGARGVLRPTYRRLDRVPLPGTGVPRRLTAGAPLAVLVAVYRCRNARVVESLVDDARAAGWRVALWALDEVDERLAPFTVGHGAGARTELLSQLAAIVAPGDDEYVVLADDDVEVVRNRLIDLVGIAHAAGLGLAQPAHSRSSHFWHPLTVARPVSLVRRTTFVEIGPVVLVSPMWRDRVLPFPAGFGMGWGLELLWAELQREGCLLGIVDAVHVRHRDPIAVGYDGDAERARVGKLLEERGLASMHLAQRTLGVWRRGRPAPPWDDVDPGRAGRRAGRAPV